MSEDEYSREQVMTHTLSIRIDAETKKRLNECKEWQLGELHAGIAELESGREVSHEKVSKWLNSWGKPDETNAPV